MKSAIVLALTLETALSGCRGSDEAQAEAICERARALEAKSPKAALALKRRLYEEMPTAGTRGAKQCVQSIRTRMGKVRVLVSEDETGAVPTLEGCAWAADVMEVFGQSVNPPFKRRWAERLMERCATAVGRAWTRAPDDPELMALHERLVKLAK